MNCVSNISFSERIGFSISLCIQERFLVSEVTILIVKNNLALSPKCTSVLDVMSFVHLYVVSYPVKYYLNYFKLSLSSKPLIIYGGGHVDMLKVGELAISVLNRKIPQPT